MGDYTQSMGYKVTQSSIMQVLVMVAHITSQKLHKKTDGIKLKAPIVIHRYNTLIYVYSHCDAVLLISQCNTMNQPKNSV